MAMDWNALRQATNPEAAQALVNMPISSPYGNQQRVEAWRQQYFPQGQWPKSDVSAAMQAEMRKAGDQPTYPDQMGPPSEPGTSYGQRSPGGRYFWDGSKWAYNANVSIPMGDPNERGTLPRDWFGMRAANQPRPTTYQRQRQMPNWFQRTFAQARQQFPWINQR